jgi:outer membrane lipoprotein SlyB
MLNSLLPRRTVGGQVAAAATALLLVSGCVNSSKNVYEGRDVGRMIDTTEATVVSSRVVNIKEESKGYGPLAGAAVGGLGAGLAANANHNVGLIAALGAVAGAGVGYLAEQWGRSRDGIEYTVRTQDGRVMTLIQNKDSAETPIPAGKAVLVQHAGTYTRVIEKPEGLEDQWRNPDAKSGGGAAGGSAGGSGTMQGSGGAPGGAIPGGGATSTGGGGTPQAAPRGGGPSNAPDQ